MTRGYPLRPVLPLVLLLVATPAWAQGDIERRGAWGMFAVGAGSAGADCGFCSNDRQWGPSGQLAFGGTPSRNVLLGGAVSAYARIEDQTDVYLGWALGIARVYPARRLGLFVSGGAGVNYGHGTTSSDSFDALGAGFLAGVGWDLGLAPRLGITILANVLFSAGGYLEQNGVEATNSGFSPSLFQAAVGMTFF